MGIMEEMNVYGRVEQWDDWSKECSHTGWDNETSGAMNVRTRGGTMGKWEH
jgi:hypothetical protein